MPPLPQATTGSPTEVLVVGQLVCSTRAPLPIGCQAHAREIRPCIDICKLTAYVACAVKANRGVEEIVSETLLNVVA